MRIRKKILNKFFIFISLFFLLCSIFLLANITPGLKGSIDQELRIILKQTDRIFSYNIQRTFSNFYSSIRYINKNNNKYEKLNIDISFKNIRILKKERKEALLLGKNLSRKKVPIQISFNGKKYKASARLKGGLSDHYGNNKQFSLMIKIRKGQSIDGMREFSLTQHFSRQFPQNIVYSDMLSSLGLATPKFITYKINLNGDDWGLMLAEEQYSDAYFELREKKYSPTVKFTNEDNSDIFRTLFNTSNINNDNQQSLIKDLTRHYEQLLVKSTLRDKSKNIIEDKTINNVKVRFQKVIDLPTKDLRKLIDSGKKELKEGIIVIFAMKDEKVGLAIGVTENLSKKYDAVKLVKIGSDIIGGKGGGGRTDFAQAGGIDSSKIDDAIEQIKNLI